jgi:hypothetical protein
LIDDGWLIKPRNMQTQRYVDTAWEQLHQGDWPRFTAQAAFHQLDWTLTVPQAGAAELRLVDASGHRFRELFAGDLEAIPEHLRGLANYCRAADIVVFLINMQDFLGVPSGELRNYNELSLVFALDYVTNTSGKSCCAVFTQTDLYPQLAEQHGEWDGVAKTYLPKLWASHLQSGQVPVFAVAAIDRTEVRPDEQGLPRRFPAKDFGSQGFESLLTWLSQALQRQRSRRIWRDVRFRLAGAALPLSMLIAILLGWFCLVIPAYHWLTDKPIPVEVNRILKTVETKQSTVLGHPFGAKQYKLEQGVEILNEGAKGEIAVLLKFKKGDFEQTFGPIKKLVKSRQHEYFSCHWFWFDTEGADFAAPEVIVP